MHLRSAGVFTALVAGLLFILGASARTASAQTVNVELTSFGVAGMMRPGDWIAIKVKLTADSVEPVTAEVSWEVPNADGDDCENTRVVTLAGGQSIEKWLYARLPPSTQPFDLQSNPWTVRVFKMEDGRRVSEIGATRISGQTATTGSLAIDMDKDLILVLGDRKLGLEQYQDTLFNDYEMPPGLQARTMVASGATLADLPDRWQGLAPFSAIIWCDSDRRPSQLSSAQASALREWIWRGGTLVIGIARAPDAWGIDRAPGSHELEDLLPSAPPKRLELRIGDVAPIVSKYESLRDPTRATPVYVWDPAKLDRGYRPIVSLPSPKAETGLLAPRPGKDFDGAVVGVQRNFGFGMIVVLGLDVDQLSTQGVHTTNIPVPQADTFWNRILGRRGDTPTAEEMQRYISDTSVQILNPIRTSTSELGSGRLISERIGLTSQAALGVLAASLIFLLYWLLSGPMGFFGLKQFKRERHSWVLFVAIAFLFTAVAWAGGALISPTSANLRHVTVIDQLGVDPAQTDTSKGIPDQRATSWMSVYFPSYGPTSIKIGDEDDANANDLLSSWSPPPSGTGDSFPNKDRYRVDAEVQSEYLVPARKTSADFVARWRGVISPEWGAPVSVVSPVELRVDRQLKPHPISIVGALKHGLPGTLQDVRVTLVVPQRTPLPAMTAQNPPRPRPDTSGLPPLDGRMVSPVRGMWAPNTPLDLGALFGDPAPFRRGVTGSIDKEFEDRYYGAIAQSFASNFGVGNDSLDDDRRRLFLEMLTYFWMLEPPHWIRFTAGEQTSARAARHHARELDLSPWMTRPVLIITGFLDGSSCPIPVEVDGELVPGEGLTMFRYILPLDDSKFYDMLVPEMVTKDQSPEPPTPPSTPPTD
ncbi:MAG: hypothetical protein JNM94_16645 [Phycisphaerae bacterium]|nr:hypothetical protein [Phycisphaerae bacterium]